MHRTRSAIPAGNAPRRLRVLALAWGLCCLVLVGRLVQVQGLERHYYQAQAQRQHEREVPLKARRGRILDRHGNVLAMDAPARSFYANPEAVEDPEAVAAHFARVTGRPRSWFLRQLRRHAHFVYLARQLDESTAARVLSRDFVGVHSQVEVRRDYPQGTLGAQVVGFTNIDHRGSAGVEWAWDDVLRGVDGFALWQVDATGVRVPGSQRRSSGPKDGSSVVLTLDMVFQDILEQELERAVENSRADAGMGIITDPRTGEILAMANVPQFDPARPGDTPVWQHRNRTVTDAYEPGSTFKIFTLAAVLQEKVASPDDSMDCRHGRYLLPDGEVIRDHRAYGTLSLRQVIENSSNIGTIEFAQRLSRRQMYRYVRSFGFAARTGCGLPGESPGLLAQVDRWSERSLATIAMGQEISVTALQLAQGVGAVANDGVLLAPHIIKGIIHADGSFEPKAARTPVRRVISSRVARQVRRILQGVVDRGTGRLAAIEGIPIAGKTGTAQKAAEDGNGYDPNRHVVSFVGFLPVDVPRLLCLIVVDSPRRNGWGGKVAAPVFRRVMERILNLPDGLQMARRPTVQAAGARSDPIPDFRGLSRRTARYQASLRGLPVAFEGQGDFVVQQDPVPGEMSAKLVQVSCTLGNKSARNSSAAMKGLLARQMRVMEALSSPLSGIPSGKL